MYIYLCMYEYIHIHSGTIGLEGWSVYIRVLRCVHVFCVACVCACMYTQEIKKECCCVPPEKKVSFCCVSFSCTCFAVSPAHTQM